MTRILAVYGSAYGQTERIVRRMADRLSQHGIESTVLKGDAVTPHMSLAGYDGYLVAASIIAGRHQRYIEEFVKHNLRALSGAPSVFISVSGAAGDKRPSRQAEARRYVQEFLKATGWLPWRTATFGGAMAYTQYGFFLRSFTKWVSSRRGGPTDTSRDHEFTDWEAVDRFAGELEALVRPGTPVLA
jgi:menaquinone-dependent protoporphyrinogen oxidase